MAKHNRNRKKLNPYNPVFTGVRYMDELEMQLFKYNGEEFAEDTDFDLKHLKKFPQDNMQYWLNIHGVHDLDKILEICKRLEIHSLTVQNILDVNQRPKFQEHDKYWYFSIKSLLSLDRDELQSEQISFILGENYLISFQEKKADYFHHIRVRLRENAGIVRERSSDFLLYLMFESILDNYFKTFVKIEAKTEALGTSDINSDPSPQTLQIIETYKRQLDQIRKTIIPIREFVVKIEREEMQLVKKQHLKYFYEVKDMCSELIDDCDKLDMKLESNINMFFSIQGHRMNQVMKTLTVVATIFIPLTFVAGIYGMNFANMPELSWKWGYLFVWIVMILMFAGMMFYFRKKKWF